MAHSILVVDDDPAIRRLLSTALLATGWNVEEAEDGLDGLQLAESGAYDLLITDLRMPRLDGMELLRRIRAVRPALKVIVMTGDSTPSDVIESIREHAFSYVGKPFEVSAIADLVRRALESTSVQDEIEVLSARPEWISLRVHCRMETAERLVHFVRAMETRLPPQDREHMAMAFREMLLNAIEHGAGSDPNKKVYVSCVRTARDILYYIRDPGAGFAIDQLPHAAISNRPEEPAGHAAYRDIHGMRPGGFGILLVRNLVDELIYNEKGNEVLLIKYLT